MCDGTDQTGGPHHCVDAFVFSAQEEVHRQAVESAEGCTAGEDGGHEAAGDLAGNTQGREQQLYQHVEGQVEGSARVAPVELLVVGEALCSEHLVDDGFVTQLQEGGRVGHHCTD